MRNGIVYDERDPMHRAMTVKRLGDDRTTAWCMPHKGGEDVEVPLALLGKHEDGDWLNWPR